MRREGRWYIIDAYCGYFFLKRTGFSFHIVAFCFLLLATESVRFV